MKVGGMTGGSRLGRALRRGASGSALVLAVACAWACYSTGGGTPPPPQDIYFPVGLAVSAGGNVLYVANSDFDLQYNGGTLQSYDLASIRNDALRLLVGVSPSVYHYPFLPGVPQDVPCDNSASQYPPLDPNGTGGVRIGWLCAPPMDNHAYWRDAVVIGAFATDLQLARVAKNRLFVPVRGDASLTWADIASDVDPNTGASVPASPGATKDTYAPFFLDCGRTGDGRCDDSHHAGNNPDEQGNTRHITMPGEPFGMAQTEDGQAVVITHQTDTKVSLLLTGLSPNHHDNPSLQFVLDGLPAGGVGVAAVPHDPAATPVMPWPAFLWTSRTTTEVDLLRFHPDEGFSYDPADASGLDYGDAEAIVSTTNRPYLIREQAFTINSNSSGVENHGLAIDPTPRIACEQNALAVPGTTTSSPSYVACARTPARVFIANRTPSSLIVGEIGETGSADGTKYDPDHLAIFGNVPLNNGPSNVYLAPIVDKSGHYALRVFIVCYDAQAIWVYDPDAQRVENVIRVGTAPFAMAFDPFDWTDVAMHRAPAADPRANGIVDSAGKQADLKTYRFAYIANFTTSYVQVMDLDASFTTPDFTAAGASSFETIVFTLGRPTQPKGQ